MLIDSEELKKLVEEYSEIESLEKKHLLFAHESIRKGVLCMAQVVLNKIAELEQSYVDCFTCHGMGWLGDGDVYCNECSGTGQVKRSKLLIDSEELKTRIEAKANHYSNCADKSVDYDIDGERAFAKAESMREALTIIAELEQLENRCINVMRSVRMPKVIVKNAGQKHECD